MEKKFQRKIVYQIYSASFKDNNNDGWGDLKGIISKLDYLKDLGIGIIWLSPIYASPMDDMGYDISDYKKINPLFGTMEDFDLLIKEAKKKDIDIVMDLVINHTSTEHEWFKKAIEEKENKYRNYYFIKQGKGKKQNKAPNNWQSAFSGSAWKKIDSLPGYYYLHLYCDTQADLNYDNEEVIKEVEEIIKFYLDKGVYGFRCDVINQIYKSSLKNDYRLVIHNRGSKYYLNQDKMFKILTRIRSEVLDNYDTFLVGETGELSKEATRRFIDERCLDTFFEFEHTNADRTKFVPILKVKFKPKNFAKSIFKFQNRVPRMANYLENHDQLRSINRYGNASNFYKESGKMLCLFLLSLRGTPFIYQGQEIGMLNYENNSFKDCKDVATMYVVNTINKYLHISKDKIFKVINNTINRDNARSLMQWNKNPNAGFNDGNKPWIKVNDLYTKINVEDELKDNSSILNFYKKMIKFRNESEVLIKGSFKEELVTNSIISFYRKLDDKIYLIICNFSNKSKKYMNVLNLKLLISNYEEEIVLDKLPPYFAGIYEVI